MQNQRRLFLVAAIAFSASVSCRRADPADSPGDTPTRPPINASVASAQTTKIDPQVGESGAPDTDHSRRQVILQAARDYHNYHNASDWLNWSPEGCAAPPPTSARFSASDEKSTHGRKLYFLYARELDPYINDQQHAPQPVGQSIVKESWIPVEVDPARPSVAIDSTEAVAKEFGSIHDTWLPAPAEQDGKHYQPGEKGPLFIMHYLGTNAPNTDDGWIYATLTPDGSQITAMGKIVNCMKCHQSAPHGRLFGLRTMPADDPTLEP